ncbi:hypothetical protein [Halorarius halobius]|uniref:hypothetical protein n=1 Tax=Halorarius halobius TaxID=2962671 RepID=UPI0020CD608F|nr:hypothetical protein [Halorarius halobius]
MVGPISSEERSAFALKVKLALTALVAGSAGLIAVAGDASLPVVAAAVVGGVVAGAALIWFVFPGSGETKRGGGESTRDGDDRFGR